MKRPVVLQYVTIFSELEPPFLHLTVYYLMDNYLNICMYLIQNSNEKFLSIIKTFILRIIFIKKNGLTNI